MKKYQLSDFESNNTWLIFRLDAFLENSFIDIYVVMDLPSGMILSNDVAKTELSQKQVDGLLKGAFANNEAPDKILLASPDPVEPFLEQSVKNLRVQFETVSARSIEELVEPMRLSFFERFGGTFMRRSNDIRDDEADYECARRSIPDSYDLCSCGSGLKYKFCCKRIIIEMVEAMCAAEEGDLKKALKGISKARKLVGNTAEVICREAIVYNFFDPKKGKELLKQCLEVNPKHPRAHYLQAINLVEQGKLKEAISSYEKAISYYPTTDHYHLNEVHNNLANVYYRMGNYAKAKSEWELALQFMPFDKMTRRNLEDFIYDGTT